MNPAQTDRSLRPRKTGGEAWTLLPEGGILHQAERTAVIADVHMGYEWARGAAGDCVPGHSLAETLDKLQAMLQRGVVTRLIVAGDLVESSRPCAHTREDLATLRRWLVDRGVQLVLVVGNHDRGLWSRAQVRGGGPTSDDPDEVVPIVERLEVAGWTIAHGHQRTRGTRQIIGHHHPAFVTQGQSVPCILAGPSRIILPAFSRNAAGMDVAARGLPPSWRGLGLRCYVCAGRELLDFGPLETLSGRLPSARRQAPAKSVRAPRPAPSRLDRLRRDG